MYSKGGDSLYKQFDRIHELLGSDPIPDGLAFPPEQLLAVAGGSFKNADGLAFPSDPMATLNSQTFDSLIARTRLFTTERSKAK